MDKPTIKEQLQQYGKLTKELKQLEERIQTLRSSMYSLKSPTFDDVPCCGGASDKIGNVVCLMESLEEKYLDMIETITECQEDISNMISILTGEQQLLITLRYISQMSWVAVANMLGHDNIRKTQRLEAWCLEKLEDRGCE